MIKEKAFIYKENLAGAMPQYRKPPSKSHLF